MVLFKKFLAVLIAAVMMICCAAVTVYADDNNDNGCRTRSCDGFGKRTVT